MRFKGMVLSDETGAKMVIPQEVIVADVKSEDGRVLSDLLDEKLGVNGDGGELKPTFAEAESRINIYSGLKLSTILGSIKKWFSDMKSVAFTGAYADLTGKPTSMAPIAHAASHRTGGGDALSAADIGAAPASHTHTPASLGAVPTSRKINGRDLTADLTLNAVDVGAATVQTFTATIPTTGWSASAPYTVNVAVSGVTAAMTPIVDVVLSATAATAKLQLAAWSVVGRIVTYGGGITVYCYDTAPTTAIPIQMKVVI